MTSRLENMTDDERWYCNCALKHCDILMKLLKQMQNTINDPHVQSTPKQLRLMFFGIELAAQTAKYKVMEPYIE